MAFNPGSIRRMIEKRKKEAAAKKAGQISSAEAKFQSLVSQSGQLAGEGDLSDPLAAIRKQSAEAESLLAQAGAAGEFRVAGQTSKKFKKKDVENLLKATGMREAELRAKKAAPGFNQTQSLVG